MKKGILLAVLACVPVGLYADADIEVVQVSVTLRRDKEKCSDKRWAKVVAPVQAMRKQVEASMEDALEMVDAVTHAMRSVTRDGDNGIHGEISAVVSDGECASSCGDGCPCKETGACLCAVKGTACSQECGCPGGDPMDEEAVRGCEDGSCTRDDK
jgi:hypothetical protein